MSRLEALFAATRAAGRAAVFPYLTAGYPDLPQCEELLVAAAEAGADGLEIGIPFSDPLADGMTQQRASQVALAGGATPAGALELAARVQRRAAVPLVIMSYLNPLLAYGFEQFAADAAGVGVDGLIIPDLPSDEAAPYRAACRAHGLDYVYLLAPTSTEQRIAAVAREASGFIYCVAVVGVTGARERLSDELAGFLARVRCHTDIPLLVGFGVSRPEHVRAIRDAGADAVVVASALVDLLEVTPPEERRAAVRAFVSALRLAAGGVAPV